MYRLLIVEDEFIEREALASLVDWAVLGVELVASAESAEEAITLSLTTTFDILLTDIRLLGMSGLELARALLQRQPGLKVIINSGYSDFEYARQAVELHACSYITKPIDLGELNTVFRRVVQELDEEREQARSTEQLKQLVQENLPSIRRHFFERLLAGTMTDQEIIKSLNYFNIDAVQGRFAVILAELDGFDKLSAGLDWEGLQMMLESVRKAVHSLSLDGMLDFFYEDRGRFCAFLGLAPMEQKAESRHVFAAAERIRNEAALAAGGTVTVGIGCTVGRIRDLKQSFQTATLALAYKFSAGQGQVISHVEAALADFEPGQIDMLALEETLVLSLEMADGPEACRQVDKLFRSAGRRGWDGHRVYAACIRLLSRMLMLLHDLKEPDDNVFEGGAIWGRLLECQTIPEMRDIMHGSIEKAAAQLMERRAIADRSVVRHIIEYIEQNLEKRITAADLADEFFYSPNYIGVVFKKDMGITLTDYLKDTRLERARSLLKNPINRVGEVATKVGYPNLSYFCSLFKKKYGVNPGEYKENA